mmetsp:Transcript_60742/g.169817  ORF Transcript_60742/g.169817 Transcript_60742/m.169817 type:complete len:246 (-) Transcript_60742:1004-1741(-)
MPLALRDHRRDFNHLRLTNRQLQVSEAMPRKTSSDDNNATGSGFRTATTTRWLRECAIMARAASTSGVSSVTLCSSMPLHCACSRSAMPASLETPLEIAWRATRGVMMPCAPAPSSINTPPPCDLSTESNACAIVSVGLPLAALGLTIETLGPAWSALVSESSTSEPNSQRALTMSRADKTPWNCPSALMTTKWPQPISVAVFTSIIVATSVSGTSGSTIRCLGSRDSESSSQRPTSSYFDQPST